MQIEIQLLGNFHIRLNGNVVGGFRQPRRQTLLAYLLIHVDQPISRQAIAFLLWPDSSQKQAFTNLRNLIYKVRKALPEVDHFLELTNQTVLWKSSPHLKVDLLEFEASLRDAAAASTEASKEANYELAAKLYTGDFLAGLYDEWILKKGEALKGEYKSALHHLTNFRWQYGDYPEAITYAQRLLSADPLQESTYCLMMDVYLSQGDRGGALNVYHSCVTMLREELGVDPGSAIQQRYNQALHESSSSDSFIAPPSATITVATPFVGRVTEQRRLSDAWTTTKLGRSKITFIHGVSGSGKTRLAAEFVDSIKRKGGATLHARGYAAQGEALGVISNLFVGNLIQQAIHHLDDIWYRELIRILPELSNDRPHLTSTTITQRWEQQRFYEAISKAIVSMSDTIVIHLDDLQWFDSDSLSWLRFFMEYRHNSKIMIIGTVRDDEIDEDHPANLLHYDLTRRNLSEVIELSPLTKEDVGALASQVSDLTLSEAALAQIQTETEGSPLYIIELLKSGAYSDYVAGEAESESNDSHRQLPEKIEAAIKWRLGQLSKETRKLVSAAAVVGRGFDYNLIDTIGSGLGVDVLSALDELWRRRLIAERENFRYDFAHDYIRNVAYAETSPILRRGLHKKTAEAIREQHSEQLDFFSGQIAAHLAKAGDYKEARLYYERAGDHALAQFSTRDAFNFYSSALVMWPEHEIHARYSLHLKREEILYQLLDLEAWKKELAILKELALLLQKEEAYSRRPLTVFLFRQGLYLKNSSSETKAIKLLKQAIWLAKRYNHVDIEIEASRELGMSYFNLASYTEGRAALEHAIDLAKKHRFTALEGSALEDIAAVFLFSGEDINLLKRHLNRVHKLSKENSDLILEARILNKLGYLPAEQGESELAEAESAYSDGLKITKSHGLSFFEGIIHINLITLYTQWGEYDKGLLQLKESDQLIDAHRLLNLFSRKLHYSANLYFNMGAYEKGKRRFIAAIKELQRENRRGWLCKAYNDYGFLAYLSDDLELAVENLNAGLKVSNEIGEQRQIAVAKRRLGRIAVDNGAFTEAETQLQTAKELHLKMGQINRAIIPVAHLTEMALKQNDLSQALAYAEEIWNHLTVSPIDWLDESLYVYLAAYRVFTGQEDKRAADVKQMANAHFSKRVNSLSQPSAKLTFWEAPLHAHVCREMGIAPH